ncbi:hypothetical protein [Kitasatospora sp. NPDC002965]
MAEQVRDLLDYVRPGQSRVQQLVVLNVDAETWAARRVRRRAG